MDFPHVLLLSLSLSKKDQLFCIVKSSNARYYLGNQLYCSKLKSNIAWLYFLFLFQGKKLLLNKWRKKKKEQKHEILKETCHSSSLNDKNANGRVYIFALAQNLHSRNCTIKGTFVGCVKNYPDHMIRVIYL